ncbi:hypothetical protein PG984_015461 [Apiospora sp. TS-2023a]
MTQVGGLQSFEEVLVSGEFSDVKVVCGDRTWNLHMIILRAGSPFFKKVDEGRSEEARRDDLDLSSHKPCEVQGIITYIYTSKITSDLEKDQSLETYIRIFELGDFFGLSGLCAYGADKMEAVLVRIALTINKVAVDPFLAVSSEAFDNFSRIARFSYSIDSETFAPLRKNILGFFTSTGMNELQLGQFKELLNTVPGMAAHMSASLADKASPISEAFPAPSDSLQQLQRAFKDLSVSRD